MSASELAWSVTITVRTRAPEVAGWLERTLLPEVSRELPRARAAVHRPAATAVALEIQARDTGALRAALNTHLGWVHLALATVPLARAGTT